MTAREDLSRKIEAIEEGYEYLLAYAAQGIVDEQTSGSGGRAREFLARMDEALGGLADAFRAVMAMEEVQPAARVHAFLDVLDADARAAQAAVRLVLAQPSISSQLVDNLNASSHLRALLTDMFLLDEVVKTTLAPERPSDSRGWS